MNRFIFKLILKELVSFVIDYKKTGSFLISFEINRFLFSILNESVYHPVIYEPVIFNWNKHKSLHFMIDFKLSVIFNSI